MNSTRFLLRAVSRSSAPLSRRPLSSSGRILFKAENDAVTTQTESKTREHPNVEEFRESTKKQALTPHMTNTNSTIQNEKGAPSVGSNRPPPEFLSMVDPDYTPKDSHPENTERMTGGTQAGDPDKVGQASSSGDYDVGEMEGAQFKIEPLRRHGEDLPTMRSRLLCSYTSAWGKEMALFVV